MGHVQASNILHHLVRNDPICSKIFLDKKLDKRPLHYQNAMSHNLVTSVFKLSSDLVNHDEHEDCALKKKTLNFE